MQVTGLTAATLVIPDGALVLPSEPGLGIVLDDAAVDRFSRDGWR